MIKFKIASKALASTLSGVSKVISSKNTLAILDNFLFEIADGNLKITASDAENTICATLPVSEAEGEGKLCLNARRISDIAKELPNQDSQFTINEATGAVKIDFPGGNFEMVGMDGNMYPSTTGDMTDSVDDNRKYILPAKQILSGIEKTLFAVGNDELRPQMMGIFWDMKEDGITFVATDTRKLVRYIDRTAAPGKEDHFILPFKPAVILRSLFDSEGDVELTISERSAEFRTADVTLTTRFIKGQFPDYNRVIPRENPLVLTVDRGAFLTAVRRVSVCADPAHGLVKMRLTPQLIEMKVDDPNVNSFAHEKVPCDFTGNELVIGFSGAFLMEIFNTLDTENIIARLADPSRPGVFEPDTNEPDTEMIVILMPMSIVEF